MQTVSVKRFDSKKSNIKEKLIPKPTKNENFLLLVALSIIE